MKIAYVIYPDFTALDLIGPYEVISLWPDVELHWVATTTGPVTSDHGLTVLPTTTPAQLPDPDVVVIPGSSKPLGPLDDEVLLDWVRQVAPTATWLASACTGSARLRRGRRAGRPARDDPLGLSREPEGDGRRRRRRPRRLRRQVHHRRRASRRGSTWRSR